MPGKPTLACFIDFQKAFDCVNRELLCFQLLKTGIDGKFYNSLKAIYQNPESCVQVNDYRTGWFPTPYGVKQGDGWDTYIYMKNLLAICINSILINLSSLNINTNFTVHFSQYRFKSVQ